LVTANHIYHPLSCTIKIKGNKLVNFVLQCHLPEFDRGEKRLYQSMKMLSLLP
jgi:hypothetical protein